VRLHLLDHLYCRPYLTAFPAVINVWTLSRSSPIRGGSTRPTSGVFRARTARRSSAQSTSTSRYVTSIRASRLTQSHHSCRVIPYSPGERMGSFVPGSQWMRVKVRPNLLHPSLQNQRRKNVTRSGSSHIDCGWCGLVDCRLYFTNPLNPCVYCTVVGSRSCLGIAEATWTTIQKAPGKYIYPSRQPNQRYHRVAQSYLL
jgi:hypothetical protein